MSDHVSDVIELAGARYRVLKRLRQQERGGAQITEYSFDKGSSWHPVLGMAWQNASTTGKLDRVEEKRDDGSLEAFVFSFLMELKDLAEGEVMQITRHKRAIVVTRSRIVIPCPIEVLDDLDGLDLRIVEGADVRRTDLQGGERPGRSGGDSGPVVGRGGEEEHDER